MVHHARTASNITEDKDRYGAEFLYVSILSCIETSKYKYSKAYAESIEDEPEC